MVALVAVVVGGLVGTGLRLGLDTMLPHAATTFPWSTLLVNCSGALVLGGLVGGIWDRARTPPWLRAGLGAGLLGSYTTLSALLGAVVTLSASGQEAAALGYLAASVLGGLTLALVGLRIGARLTRVSSA